MGRAGWLSSVMTLSCLLIWLCVCGAGSSLVDNQTGKVSDEFSAQRDEFSSAKLWVLPTKVDPIRLRRTMRDRPPFGFRRALMLTRLLIIAEKLLMYCSKKSPLLFTIQTDYCTPSLIDCPFAIYETMWENVWKHTQIDDFITIITHAIQDIAVRRQRWTL